MKNSTDLLSLKPYLASFLFNCTHYSTLRFFANRISCMNSPTCCSTIFFIISTASPFVLTRKVKNGYFMSTTLCKPPFFLYYVYKEWGHFNRRFLCERSCIQLETCWMYAEDLRQPKIGLMYVLICDFYWRLSHMYTNVARVGEHVKSCVNRFGITFGTGMVQ